jgi:hypothetical protein
MKKAPVATVNLLYHACAGRGGDHVTQFFAASDRLAKSDPVTLLYQQDRLTFIADVVFPDNGDRADRHTVMDFLFGCPGDGYVQTAFYPEVHRKRYLVLVVTIADSLWRGQSSHNWR